MHDLGEEDSVTQIFQARDLHIRRQLLVEALHLHSRTQQQQNTIGVRHISTSLLSLMALPLPRFLYLCNN